MDYFLDICKINESYNRHVPKIRIEDKDLLREIYSKLNKFYSKDFNLDNFLKLCIYLFNCQIFYDGNSRTIFEYMWDVLYRNGYDILYDDIVNNYKILRKFFPAIIDLDDIDDDDLNQVKKYVFKMEEIRGKK